MPHHAHSIDRWDDATGSDLYEHLVGVNDLHWRRRPLRPRSRVGPARRSRCGTAPVSSTRRGRLTIEEAYSRP
jgi:hypothetical protein